MNNSDQENLSKAISEFRDSWREYFKSQYGLYPDELSPYRDGEIQMSWIIERGYISKETISKLLGEQDELY
ncbi:hypothetical protein H6G33_09590 [Calothrix sp. FACHB-1219]|uniref:hypothetical protein n=1 Tax=unclassified Calothrix TaxID=2619626 RepID=UPI001688FB04|nr:MULTISPECIES: hypothetical protein [unclassified Calothrix]MBD2201599.1 hypothetical protein [Calothrix sp. FACHB-168]MBD2217285.1 hypothetical protein [Calothrix sp. FACHB-1219]